MAEDRYDSIDEILPASPTADMDGTKAESRGGPMLDFASFEQIVSYLANAAASGVVGAAAYQALGAIRRRFGRDRVAELRQKVIAELKRVRGKGGLSNEDLRNRVDRLFDEAGL